MTVQSLMSHLDNAEIVESARKLALDHGVNLKTVIKHLTNKGFAFDKVCWIKLNAQPDLAAITNQPKTELPSQFEGVVLLIPTKLIARVRQIEQARRNANLPSQLDKSLNWLAECPDEEAALNAVGIHWLLTLLEQLKLSWVEHNILTAEGFMPVSKKQPPLPPVPNYDPPVEPYEPHEPDDSEYEPHEPSYSRANY